VEIDNESIRYVGDNKIWISLDLLTGLLLRDFAFNVAA
jgi:hypothetical protein